MLKKIDCILLKVPDLKKASKFYCETLGLLELWQDERQIGLGMPGTDAEIVLHTDERIPTQVDVNYLVDDVVIAVQKLIESGFEILVLPFDIVIGKCAVVKDPIGNTWSILDMTKGPRKSRASDFSANK